MIGLVFRENLDRVDARVVINDPMMLAAEQQQILHRVDVVRQRRSFRPRPLAADAHDVRALRESSRAALRVRPDP
ncbi:MAG TPA: hypothetical protein VE464_18620 [Streptosporangiaceae bacterium]|nr:hypothetical protein [Streptosporangiaceae bacterium]